MSGLTLAVVGALAVQCAPHVAPETIAAIARTESALDPLAIGDNTTHTAYHPASEAEAIETANRLLTAGHNLDLGLMQVNTANFAAYGLTVPTAFQPCANIRVGAAILDDAYQLALRRALSRYNTGSDTRGFANGYVRKVEASAARVVPALHVPGTLPPAPLATVAAPGSPLPAPDPLPPAWDVAARQVWAARHGTVLASSADRVSSP